MSKDKEQKTKGVKTRPYEEWMYERVADADYTDGDSSYDIEHYRKILEEKTEYKLSKKKKLREKKR